MPCAIARAFHVVCSRLWRNCNRNHRDCEAWAFISERLSQLIMLQDLPVGPQAGLLHRIMLRHLPLAPQASELLADPALALAVVGPLGLVIRDFLVVAPGHMHVVDLLHQLLVHLRKSGRLELVLLEGRRVGVPSPPVLAREQVLVLLGQLSAVPAVHRGHFEVDVRLAVVGALQVVVGVANQREGDEKEAGEDGHVHTRDGGAKT